jgi:hypothetical protein
MFACDHVEDKMNLQEDIDDIMFENGPLSDRRAVPSETVEKYTGKLPLLLTTFWGTQGIGSWKNGLFTLCLPTDFQGLLSQVFAADPDFSHQDCHVIGHSSFGHLLLWSERHWVTQIDLLNGRISCPVLIDPTKAKHPDIHLSTNQPICGFPFH